jgi:hypothetical protein
VLEQLPENGGQGRLAGGKENDGQVDSTLVHANGRFQVVGTFRQSCRDEIWSVSLTI